MLTGLIMYVKLFQSIYQGTLRGNSNGLLVFTNLLAHADQYGIVDVHPKAIAEEVGLTLEQVKEALTELEAPDIESRSPESEGRRIVLLDGHRAWGWQIVNYVKYRAIKNEDDRREQNREAQARWREKNKQVSSDVSSVSRGKPMQKQKHIQKKSEKNTATDVATPDGVSESIWLDFLKIRKSKRAPMTETALIGIIKEANKAGLSLSEALSMSCARGWQSFEASWAKKDSGLNKQEALEAGNSAVLKRFMEKDNARL